MMTKLSNGVRANRTAADGLAPLAGSVELVQKVGASVGVYDDATLIMPLVCKLIE